MCVFWGILAAAAVVVSVVVGFKNIFSIYFLLPRAFVCVYLVVSCHRVRKHKVIVQVGKHDKNVFGFTNKQTNKQKGIRRLSQMI